MRILRAISDLPWWTGLPIFLVGNLIVSYGMVGYMVGLVVCLFGLWIFSKLLKYNEYSTNAGAIVGLPIFAIGMFYLKHPLFDLTWDFSQYYTARVAFGIFFGFISFNGFKK